MAIEPENKFPRVGPPPSKGWRIWDRLVDAGALVVMTILLLPAIFVRAFIRTGQRFRIAGMSDQYEKQNYRVALGARRSTDLMKIHFDQLRELEECYLTTPWNSLEEAQAGYKLLQVARAALIAEAQAEAQRRSLGIGL